MEEKFSSTDYILLSTVFINKFFMDYKNIELLQQFISEQGKIIPREMTGLSSKEQRALKKAVKKARTMGLLYYTLNFRGKNNQNSSF